MECNKCKTDLVQFVYSSRINFCPICGAHLDEVLSDRLHDMTFDKEIKDMMTQQILDVLNDGNYKLAWETLPETIWEGEAANGAMFCSNYKARMFSYRHHDWLVDMLDRLIDYGCDSIEMYDMFVYSADCFIALAFSEAARNYIIGLGFDGRTGEITQQDRQEIRDKMKEMPYDTER